jgi:phosphate transport system substrate-binding protein
MNKNFRRNRVMMTTILAASIGLSVPAIAEVVTLSSNDGALTVSGNLISTEDGFYRIDTTIGVLSISVADVTCAGDACPVFATNDEITAIGSSSIGSRLMPLLLAGYSQSANAAVSFVPGSPAGMVVNDIVSDAGNGELMARVSVSLSDSTSAFRALLSPDTQIGMSTRRVLPAEARRVTQSRGGNLIDPTQEHVIAVDPVVIMVHPSNPVTAISLEQLDQIYSGQLTNWADLGGPNAPIIIYGRDQSSGIATTFLQTIFSKSGNRQAGSVIPLASDQQMANTISTQPYAVGFAGVAFANGTKALNIIDQCGIEVGPDSFTTKAEEYPIQRRLYLYNRSDNVNEATAAFLAYTDSSGADSVIANGGFYNLAVERDTRLYQGERTFDVIAATTDPAEKPIMAELVVDLLSYDRLTSTFRFTSGSSSLEPKAFTDLDRLIKYINEQDHAVELYFAGFSDADGSFNANRALSLGRAQQVATAASDYMQGKITNPNGVTFAANGYGELLPVACNSTLEGKRTNRRVEVWIRRQ